MSPDTRAKLLHGALAVLGERGIAGVSARAVAAAAGVNQALVFYHYGSVDELLASACEFGAQQRMTRYREELSEVRTLRQLLDLGRALHAREQAEGQVMVLGQLLAGAQRHPKLAEATTAGLGQWTTEIEAVLRRVLQETPLSEFVDPRGLAKAVSAAFLGLELYEGVDPDGGREALDALDQLAALAGALEGLGPVTRRAVRARLARTVARRDTGPQALAGDG